MHACMVRGSRNANSIFVRKHTEGETELDSRAVCNRLSNFRHLFIQIGQIYLVCQERRCIDAVYNENKAFTEPTEPVTY